MSNRWVNCGANILESKYYEPCNIYDSVIIGTKVNIGAFTEIGERVSIGDRTRIGGGCFIPEGVSIGKDVFIGPHVCFTNDKFPPSGKENWGKTIVKDGARIGAAVTILPGLVIGSKCLIGAGSVVCKDVPDGEIWVGNSAKCIRKISENKETSQNE